MNEIKSLLERAVSACASDIFIVAGFPESFKIGGKLTPQGGEKITPERSLALITALFALAEREMDAYLASGDDDFSFSIPGLSRFRVSAYRQRNSLAAVVRVVSFGIPDYRELHIPETVMAAAEKTKGLILVTGTAGSGKSTTLACLIDRINANRSGHIITLEDPIEYLHRNKQCIVSQREIAHDTENYVAALRAALRQAPDVIFVGEMRDYETIKIAMTAAETGHLVISTLHTVGAANTIDRIIDVFPPNQQPQIRVQLAMLLQSVFSQQLVPTADGGVYPAFEILHTNNAVRNLIRESKIHQLDTLIASSAAEGMVTMDASLLALCKNGTIGEAEAIRFAANPELLQKKLHQ